MTTTQDVLLDAAEQLVRAEGLDALTMRSLAARANYGKSTVHEALGGVDQLVRELRRRASRELVAVCTGEGPAEPEHPAWRRGLYRRVSEWIIENPHWAEVCFLPHGVAESHDWTHPVATLLTGGLPDGLDGLSEPDGAEMAELASRAAAAVVPTVILMKDVDYGARLFEATFVCIHEYLQATVDLRADEIDLR